jgi:hypothetical protein
MADEPRYWYAARTHRWVSRRPLTWEGWLVDIGLFASFVGISPYVSEREHPLQSLELVIGVLALYFAIVHWKGEPKNKNWDD